jgi:outer membrane protein OmpA-like peptidoglycan-associated protein
MLWQIIVVFFSISLSLAEKVDESSLLKTSNPKIQFLTKHVFKSELPSATRYTISTDALFKQDLSYTSQIEETLFPVIEASKNARRIMIHAFSDAGLQDRIGVAISNEQAQRVMDYLWFKGINYNVMAAQGMGFSEERLLNNKEVLGDFFNRRIEIDIN